MTRYKLTIEYDGTGLMGWQYQPHGESVQGHIEAAILGCTGEQVRLHCAGRTDAGVHGVGQVAHVDLEVNRSTHAIMLGINHHLRPNRIVLTKVEAVSYDFHARFHAQKRYYMYRIINRKSWLMLEKNRVWQIPYELDIPAMKEAASIFIGEHDFSSFRASACQANSPIKTMDRLEVVEVDGALGREIHIYAEAKSFLHHQIRNLAGSLAYVGQGKWSVDDLIAAKAAKDRKAGGPTAPAHGLYFIKVDYPK